MIDRNIRPTIQHRLEQNPAVVLVGPRQCGKTTLAASFDGIYFDIEQESDRLRLDLSWDELVAGDRLIILDEAQSWPELFPRLRGTIDRQRRQNGRFLLLGSVAPSLMTQVSESLAGRLSILELSPLLYSELPGRNTLKRNWFYGGFPDGGILNGARYPQWGLDYMHLLVARDLPEWGFPARPQMADRLVRMVAALHAQNWNASQVAGSLGISPPTATSYLDFLEGAFLVRRLQPWQTNMKKRLVKTPKIYWRDSGLLHGLMQVKDLDHLLSLPWSGASWEGYVVEQVISSLHASGRPFNPWFFRTSDGYEIDLVLELEGKLWGIEIKLTSSPSVSDFNRLDTTADMIGADYRLLVSQTTRPTDGEFRGLCTVGSLIERLGGG